MRAYQQEWLQWYQGFVKDFHEYTNYQGTKLSHKRKRYSLGMAKALSETWADNMYNPETEVIIADDRVQEWWDRKKETIRFDSNFNYLQELTFALGTTATVQYSDGIESDIDYLTFDKIYPLEIRNGEIESCAFASIYDIEENIVYINIHERTNEGYDVYNFFYKEDGEKYVKLEVEAVEE